MDILEKRKISCPYWDSNPRPSIPVSLDIFGHLFYPLRCSFTMKVLYFWCLPSVVSVYSMGLGFTLLLASVYPVPVPCVALFECCCLYVYIRRCLFIQQYSGVSVKVKENRYKVY
jgi:hypothetical protein